MKTDAFVQLIAFLLLLSAQHACSGSPHIIFILVDDLGWNDVSFHGSPQIPTPNIDSLAYSGIILNNYYVQPICTPSRGALMTGKYPIRLGLQHYVIAASEPWGLSTEEVLLPQYLKKLGYLTHGIGKWHLGYFQEDYIPSNRGFDTFLGYWNGKEDYFTHFEEEEGGHGLDFHENAENAWNYTGYYSTEAFTERAKKIIQSHDSTKPLFLYVAHQAVHAGNSYSPMQVPEKYSDKFSHIKDEKRRQFAGMTSALDKSIGEVFSALDEVNMLENSIIVFSTDNGGAVEGIDESTGSNWPLRGSKYNMWEGGVRGTAFIWSPLLHNSKGSISNSLMFITDWLPTLYAAAGGDPNKLGSIDGFNFWPTLIDNSSSPRDHILYNIDSDWQVEGIRRGQYKLLKGSVFNGDFDGWFDKEGKRTSDVPFSIENQNIQHEVYKQLLEESEVLNILAKKYTLITDLNLNLNRLNKSQEIEHCNSQNPEIKSCESFSLNETAERPFLHYFAPPVKVDCGEKPPNASINCQPLKEYCLFNIEKDPCEFNNLASSLPNVVEELKELLDKYRKQAVPIRNKPSDPMADPKYHGYAWVPWVKSKDLNVL